VIDWTLFFTWFGGSCWTFIWAFLSLIAMRRRGPGAAIIVMIIITAIFNILGYIIYQMAYNMLMG
jgi:CHASE2 domain-containing sensor protein